MAVREDYEVYLCCCSDLRCLPARVQRTLYKTAKKHERAIFGIITARGAVCVLHMKPFVLPTPRPPAHPAFVPVSSS